MKQKMTDRIDRYEVLCELGRGSMGIVYMAHDPKMDRTVAIKTISLFDLGRADEQEYRERFYQEARAAGRLSHPAIVTVFDVEPNPENTHPYIVMEYIEGKSLSKLLEENEEKLPLAPALRLVQDVAEGLHAAHTQGVIHRDIKPENILVTPDGRAKIADFGIARLDHGRLTVPGRMLGSPAYMSPEQLEGEDTDSRSDLFSLGVVLYTILTGHRPFQGNSTATVCFKVANRDPLPVSAWNLNIPAELDQLVGRAMAKDPAKRFQTGMEMARELRRFREEHEVVPPPFAGLMRIIGQEPEAPNGTRREGIVAEIPDIVVAQTQSHSVSLPAVISSALNSQPTKPSTATLIRRKTLKERASFLSSPILFVAGTASAALLVIVGLVIGLKPKHSANVPAPSAVTAPNPLKVQSSPIEAAGDGKVTAVPQKSTNGNLARAPSREKFTQAATRSGGPITTAPSVHQRVAPSGKMEAPSSPDPITVQMLHLSDLNVTIEHSFQEAQASISVDDRPVYREQLSGQKKRRALVFSRTEGRESRTLTLLPGKHDIVVRVQSAKDNYDASESLIRGFIPGSTSELLVKCDKRKHKLELSIK